MSVLRIALLGCVIVAFSTSALAQECKNPNALGTSRVLEVDPTEYPLVGKENYMETLRLKDHEIVLTFDDGPEPEITTSILKALSDECVKATFFMIGQQAAEEPALAKQVYDEGHSVGYHTFSHPDVEKIPFEKAKADINLGIAAVNDALGTRRPPAPWYRPPYLSMTRELERYLTSRGMMVWSIDADSDDWVPGTKDDELMERTLSRLEKVGKGILLMHDIQPITARNMPRFLGELKARGFKIVHVVPAKEQRDVALTMSGADGKPSVGSKAVAWLKWVVGQ